MALLLKRFFGQGTLGRFDVGHDVRDAQFGASEEAVLEVVGDGVSFADCEVAIDFEMNVDEVLGSAFSDLKRFEAVESGSLVGDGVDLFGQVAFDAAVEEFVHGRPGESEGVEGDEAADQQRGDVVGSSEALTSESGYGDTSEDAERGERIHAVVPGFDPERDTVG